MPIRPLPTDVVDQIAAGEVVERPAHLLKELVENSLDAGATSIEVEFDQGGRRLRVTDDGSGIARDELRLALARHATSKIAAADDLWRLSTFGFRGEALASAAAVSRLTLLSRPPSEAGAARAVSEFGAVAGPEDAAGNVGTTALVEELFANVPARLKFLKSEAAEASQIKNVLKALALSRPDVEFRARSRGKAEFAWPRAVSRLERARQVLGVERLFESEGEAGGIRVRAIFASPHDTSGQSRSVWMFAQGRWIQDRGLQAAAMDAYRGLLMHGEFPIAVVEVQAPPDEIDVNIHPTKSQVKFRDSQSAFRAVHRALRSGLERAPWLEGLGAALVDQRRKPDPFDSILNPLAEPAPANDSLEASPTAPQGASSVASAMQAYSAKAMTFEGPGFDDVRFKPSPIQAPPPSRETTLGAEPVGDRVPGFPFARPVTAAGPWSKLQVLGQAKLTYVLAQSADALVLVDQHAAHERVCYERLMRGWSGGDVDQQKLLIPLSIQLDADRADALAGAADELARVGVELERSGPQSAAVRAKPAAISDSALTKALSTLAREIAEKGGGFALERRIGDVCASMACHSAVRAGQALSREQMESLLAQMDEFPLSSFCPHGRPVSIEFPFAKLERDFGRIV